MSPGDIGVGWDGGGRAGWLGSGGSLQFWHKILDFYICLPWTCNWLLSQIPPAVSRGLFKIGMFALLKHLLHLLPGKSRRRRRGEMCRMWRECAEKGEKVADAIIFDFIAFCFYEINFQSNPQREIKTKCYCYPFIQSNTSGPSGLFSDQLPSWGCS